LSTDESQTGDTPAEEISDEVAKKYDPERLLKIISKRAGRGQALEHSIRSKYEKRFGVDLGHVRLYSGEFAEEFNRQRSAYAVTIGSTGMILMGGSPEKSMGSTSGQALLAHELTHVAQAQRGLHRKGYSGDMPFGAEHDEIEGEAEAVEADVAAGGTGGSTTEAANAGVGAMQGEDQMKKDIEKVRERVLQMCADAARTDVWRNGVSRRA
jgi:hypothetical protein